MEIQDTLRDLGYKIRDKDKLKTLENERLELLNYRRQLFLAATVTILALVIMILVWSGYSQSWFTWVMLSLALTMIFGIGAHILKMTISSLRRGILNQHVLMEFGAFGGLIG